MPETTTSPVLFYQEGTCALGALISLIWTEKPFHGCRLTEESDNENASYLELNGLGEVPLLFQDGSVITENSAILPHLAELAPARGLGFTAGTPKRDQLNRALGFLASDFHKSFLPVFSGSSFHPDEKVQAEIKRVVVEGHLREVMTYADQRLMKCGTSPDFIFESPTVADAYLFAMVRWADDLYDIGRQFPNLKRLQDAMGQNPGVQLALQIESGQQDGPTGNCLGNLPFATFVKDAARRHTEFKARAHLESGSASKTSDLSRAS